MGHKRRTPKGQMLSPWQMLQILHRLTRGETAAALADEFETTESTIGRWRKRWSHEAEYVAIVMAEKSPERRREIDQLIRIQDQAQSVVAAAHCLADSAKARQLELQ